MTWNPDRFWSKVRHETGRDACWLWSGAHTSTGYGAVYIDGIQQKAHRVAWELEHGPVPVGRTIRACAKARDCVRPGHLHLNAVPEVVPLKIADRATRGRGHIRQRGKDCYQLIAYVGADPLAGRERYKRETFHGPAKAARRRLDAIVREIDQGRHRHRDVTVGGLLDRWLAHAAPDLSPTTTKTYRGYIEREIRPALGDLPIERLTPSALDVLYGKMRERLSPASVRQCHAIIRRACETAVRWDLLVANPAARATPPKPAPGERKPPSADALRAFMAALPAIDPEVAVLARLAAVSGCRRGELVALRWDDVDVATGELTVARSVVDAGTPTVKGTKSGKARRLRLDPGTVEILRVHLAHEQEKAEFFATTFATSSPIFTNAPGTGWRPDQASVRFKSAADKAGVTFGMHALRHFAATQLIANGVDVRTVSGRLGHSQTSTTLNIYSDAVASADVAAAATIAGVLDQMA